MNPLGGSISESKATSVYLEVENIDFLDELVEKKVYRNRSDAVDASIRLLKNKLQTEAKTDAGA